MNLEFRTQILNRLNVLEERAIQGKAEELECERFEKAEELHHRAKACQSARNFVQTKLKLDEPREAINDTAMALVTNNLFITKDDPKRIATARLMSEVLEWLITGEI